MSSTVYVLWEESILMVLNFPSFRASTYDTCRELCGPKAELCTGIQEISVPSHISANSLLGKSLHLFCAPDAQPVKLAQWYQAVLSFPDAMLELGIIISLAYI